MSRTSLDDQDIALLTAPNFFQISTLRQDGTIATVPLWGHVEAGEIVLNTAEGRAWPANLRRTNTITITVSNTENPYQYVTVTGKLASETHDGADENIDALAKKYLGVDEYPYRKEGEQRVIFRIAPERVYRNM